MKKNAHRRKGKLVITDKQWPRKHHPGWRNEPSDRDSVGWWRGRDATIFEKEIKEKEPQKFLDYVVPCLIWI